MAYIYKINNVLNDKVYIGKTLLEKPEDRWKIHCKDYKKEKNENRPLYLAMNKYGIEKFSFEVIEEVSLDIVNDKEIYWIEYYRSFKNGYNATIGGDGTHYIDYDVVIETYKQLGQIKKVSEHMNIDPGTIRRILNTSNIKIKSSQEIALETTGKIINMYDLQGNYIQTFKSLKEAGRFLGDINKYAHIGDVCKGKRKTAYGYIWKFASIVQRIEQQTSNL